MNLTPFFILWSSSRDLATWGWRIRHSTRHYRTSKTSSRLFRYVQIWQSCSWL